MTGEAVVQPPPDLPRRRRRLPRLALIAGLLLLLRLVAGRTGLYGEHLFGIVLGALTAILVAVVTVWYLVRGVAWLWRRLLWRVRRRLAVTYLFVGATPIILLGMFVFISALGISAEGMARIVEVQVASATRQAAGAADRVAADLARLPGGPEGTQGRALVAERVELLQVHLPGALVRVNPDLPAWLSDRTDWSGLAVKSVATSKEPAEPDITPPAPGSEDSQGGPGGRDEDPPRLEFGAQADVREDTIRVQTPEGATVTVDLSQQAEPAVIRAAARRGTGPGAVTVLVEVPLAGALLERMREVTGIDLKPSGPALADARAGNRGADEGGAGVGVPADPLPFIYVALLPVTGWDTGAEEEQTVLAFRWSWAEAGRQLLGTGIAGQIWRQALLILGMVFLGLEVVALVAAIWMTRSVTGAVHDLHRATTFIDQGDFSQRVRVRSRDQLGELAEAFNDMSAHIEILLKERVERERMQRELEIAAGVQARLFPTSVPPLSTAAVAGECRAARGVAGDYYDYLEVKPGMVAVALGDVAGKGISASLLMSNLQASLRAQTTMAAERARSGNGGDGASVSRMTAVLNEQLCRSTDINRYATLFLLIYNDASRRLRYTNAGHNAPLLVRRDGSLERLREGGTIVGAFGDARYVEGEAVLDPDSVLLLFSDGISEATNETGEEYGEERLARLARDRRHLSAESIRSAVFDAVDAWSGAAERSDDQTLVILKGVPGSAAPA